MDEFLIEKASEAIDGFNAILDDAYKNMSEEDFCKFGEEMLAEVQRLTAKIKASNEHT